MPSAAVSDQLQLRLFVVDLDVERVTAAGQVLPIRDAVRPRHVWKGGNTCDRCGLHRKVACLGSIHARALWYFPEDGRPTTTLPECLPVPA